MITIKPRAKRAGLVRRLDLNMNQGQPLLALVRGFGQNGIPRLDARNEIHHPARTIGRIGKRLLRKPFGCVAIKPFRPFAEEQTHEIAKKLLD